MKLLPALLMLIAGWVVPAAAAAADIREDMVALDRAYIPVLVFTAEGKLGEADKAMRRLRIAWTDFKYRHYGIKTKDDAWRKDFDRVDGLLFEAEAIIGGGHQPGLAQEVLGRVRVTMMNLRRRNGIDHYVDHLTAFNEPLEGIVLAAGGREPREDASGKIRTSFATAKQEWGRVLAAEPGIGYQLTTAQRDELQRLLDSETQVLEALGKALAADDRAAILAAAVAIKPPFVRLYRSFGDFRGLP